jgi:hypothetical protein
VSITQHSIEHPIESPILRPASSSIAATALSTASAKVVDGVADHPARGGPWDRLAADFAEGHIACADDHEAVVDHVKGTARLLKLEA